MKSETFFKRHENKNKQDIENCKKQKTKKNNFKILRRKSLSLNRQMNGNFKKEKTAKDSLF